MTELIEAEWMDEELLLLRDSASRFVETEVVPNMSSWNANGCVDREIWRKAGNAGFLQIPIPPEYGGAGGNQKHEAVFSLELARSGDTAWAWSLHSICVHYIVGLATVEQKERWLPALASGDLVAAIAMARFFACSFEIAHPDAEHRALLLNGVVTA